MTERQEESGEISRLLREHAGGDDDALDRLVPLVYRQLHRIARGQVAANRRQDTLNATALVHEAYLQLERGKAVDWQDRGHFYAICARAMRRVVIDYARRRNAEKRGSGRPDLTLEAEPMVALDDVETWLAIDRALDTLSSFNERLTHIVECRYFAGMSETETAEALGISQSTVKRDWRRARAWLRRELQQE